VGEAIQHRGPPRLGRAVICTSRRFWRRLIVL